MDTGRDAISDAQKRYLFRILADQGLEGDDALSHIKERLGVENLSNVTKREASAIDRGTPRQRGHRRSSRHCSRDRRSQVRPGQPPNRAGPAAFTTLSPTPDFFTRCYMTNLTQASHELFSRPADERFETLAELATHCRNLKDRSRRLKEPSSYVLP